MTPAERLLASLLLALALGALAALVMTTDAARILYNECYLMPFCVFWFLATLYIYTVGREGEIPVRHAGRYASDVTDFITTEDGREGWKLKTVDNETLARACRYLVEHKYNFSETSMKKVGIKGKYEEFRDELLKLRWIEWKNADYHTLGLTCPPRSRATIRFNAK